MKNNWFLKIVLVSAFFLSLNVRTMALQNTECINCSAPDGLVETTVSSPSCEGNGQKQIVCQFCGAVVSNEVISALGHDMNSKKISDPVSCTEPGRTLFWCSRCDLSYYETQTIDHDWSDWQFNESEHWKACNYGCGTENSRGAHVDTNPHDYICDECGYEMYSPPVLKDMPAEIRVKKGETATFVVEIEQDGNPNTYTYQWYRATSATGTGTKIKKATSNTYSVSPKSNVAYGGTYYYCAVSNSEEHAPVNSGRTMLIADVTSPAVKLGTFNDNVEINSEATLVVPFLISDTGEGFTPNFDNFEGTDINVKIGGVATVDLGKSLRYVGMDGADYKYELTLTELKGNGVLAFEVPANSFQDNFGNTNIKTSLPTNVIVDNIAPVIKYDEANSNINKKYVNFQKTLTIALTVTESNGFTKEDFKANNIVVKVNGNVANSDISKSLSFDKKNGAVYSYNLVLSNIKGDGLLSLEIPASSIKDKANNLNIMTTLNITKGTEQVIVDNTKPVITSFSATFDDFGASRKYPDSLEERHEDWAKESIYVKIDAKDENGVDKYYKSTGNNTNYIDIGINKEVLSNSMNTTVYYRVEDKAGNFSDEISRIFKIDTIPPLEPKISLHEQIKNGNPYVYDSKNPTKNSVHVIPTASTIADSGVVKSGIEEDIEYTYYTVTRYSDPSRELMLDATIKRRWNEETVLKENGYYEIEIQSTDIAGNVIIGGIYSVYIDKRAENTIRIYNLGDIGSGIKRVTIRVFKLEGAKKEVIDPIIVENPYKEVIKNVRLGSGKFRVEVTLEDKVGLTKELIKEIENVL